MELKASEKTRLEGIRIIFVVGDLELGGAQRQALLLAQHLIDNEKATVEMWGLSTQAGDVAKACEERGIPWRLVPMNWYTHRKREKFRDLARLTLALRRARPDVILSYLIVPNVACGLVWRWTGARVCIWNQRCAGAERLGTRVERLAVKRVRWFATNSEGGAQFLVRTLGAPAERVRVIHNLIQLTPPRMDRTGWRRKLGLGDDDFVACMIANLSKHKDHATLLRAWRHFLNDWEAEGRSAVLLLAGRYDISPDTLKALAFDLDLGTNVRFMGQVQDVAGLLSAADLAVLSSPSEGKPNSALEAMAQGLAVVGTDNTGMRETLGPGGEEYLSPLGDAESLANQILRQASDSSLRAQLGSLNRLRIEKEFHPHITASQMASLILEGLQEADPRPSSLTPELPRPSPTNS